MTEVTAKDNLVWMDLEMTGLDPEINQIIEIATIITDSNLVVVETGPRLVINQAPETFESMDDWNRTHHTKSGLWAEVLRSRLTLAEAEKQTLDFLRQHTEPRKNPLCGNSIWQDRRFLCKYMPAVDTHLHYRLIDVSTVKELYGLWCPGGEKYQEKKGAHRAYDDILESIEELKFYRKNFLK